MILHLTNHFRNVIYDLYNELHKYSHSFQRFKHYEIIFENGIDLETD